VLNGKENNLLAFIRISVVVGKQLPKPDDTE
jgi:hypothetical protein